MYGGKGDDTYIVDNDSDLVVENANQGIDTVKESLTTYYLGNNVENLEMNASTAINGYGNSLDNNIIGYDANNFLVGNDGNDTIDGRIGNDQLYGGNGNDSLIGGVGNDTLQGDAGDDTIDGGAGYDSMIGGTGNDIYYVDNASDIITENANEGTDKVFSSINNYTLASNVERLELDSSITTGSGNSLDNEILGNSTNNVLYGYAGNDTIDGKAGADTMVGGIGDDIYYVDNASDVITENTNEGTDTVYETLSTYTSSNNVENLILNVSTAIYGYGNSLDNQIMGSSANNYIDGGSGNDIIWGRAGNDSIIGGDGNDLLIGEDGDFTLSGADSLYGGTGNDTIYGEAGNDMLSGSTGDDILYGGDGNDTYSFSSTDGGDIIADTAGTDKISFDSSVTRSNIAVYMDASNNLYLDYGDTSGTAQIGVVNQSTNTIETVQTNDGYYMSNTDINQLIQTMTAYATQNSIQLTNVTDVRANADLMNLVAGAWQAA